MAVNPLLAGKKSTGLPDHIIVKGIAVPTDIDEYAAFLNRFAWVVASGRPYVVNRHELPDGSTERFIVRQ